MRKLIITLMISCLLFSILNSGLYAGEPKLPRYQVVTANHEMVELNRAYMDSRYVSGYNKRGVFTQVPLDDVLSISEYKGSGLVMGAIVGFITGTLVLIYEADKIGHDRKVTLNDRIPVMISEFVLLTLSGAFLGSLSKKWEPVYIKPGIDFKNSKAEFSVNVTYHFDF